MNPVKKIRSRIVLMPTRDIDTDQIIPARFLTTTTRAGLGAHLFSELRFNADGSNNPQFALNKPQAEGCQIIVAGNNFGCGSSREHAPWALLDYGIRAIVSTQIADIFRNNALKNGLVPVVVDQAIHETLMNDPGAEICIDVEGATLTLPGGDKVSFPIDDFARHCLVKGIDQLGYLQQHTDAIENFEETRPWTP